jgi:hypothetical protein
MLLEENVKLFYHFVYRPVCSVLICYKTSQSHPSVRITFQTKNKNKKYILTVKEEGAYGAS